TSCGAPTGGKLPMGHAIGPRSGPNTLLIGDAAGSINPFNGEGIAYGYETGRLAAASLGEALRAHDAALLEEYRERLDTSYGDYFRVARSFVRLISEPKVMQACVGVGMRSDWLMARLLSIMANLLRPDDLGTAELGYRAINAVAKRMPDGVVDAVLSALDDRVPEVATSTA
ncbi:MAG TPA: hypothetical protein VGZ33_06465, partial [Acidimicrobiales bacterium]|nr:hypothetical protein [Acidimicrobiales bacterium]